MRRISGSVDTDRASGPTTAGSGSAHAGSTPPGSAHAGSTPAGSGSAHAGSGHTGSVPVHPAAPEVRCEGIGVSLDFEPVLHRLDLVVPPGEITVLVGASGSGKTTLVKHILGLLPPDEGTVAIGGHDVWTSTEAELLEVRRNLSALHSGSTVYQGSVYASLSVRENVLVSLHEKHANPSLAAGGSRRRSAVTNPYLKLWAEGVPKKDAVPELARRAQEWLDRFGLTEVADQQPHEVSGGLRRRAALAAALAVDVPLYVLDDPDGAIDNVHRSAIIDALLQTHDRTGATMLIATHDLDLAETISDRMAVLAGGRIAFQGDPRQALDGMGRWYRTPDEPFGAAEEPGPVAPPRAVVPAARGPVGPEAAPARPAAETEPAPSRPPTGESRAHDQLIPQSSGGRRTAANVGILVALAIMAVVALLVTENVIGTLHMFLGH
jgi:phospholipid/cholesterol/gamma-HCH transport system ATP-binding protein